MRNPIQIEELYEERGMEIAKAILRKKGVALVAVGSAACVRSLYFMAERMGRLDALFWRLLSRQDYSLGKQERAIQKCVQEALASVGIRGVIIYVSCMDILTGLDAEAVIDGLDNPDGIPVEILYRGPLAKRKCSPMEVLDQIWMQWGVEDIINSDVEANKISDERKKDSVLPEAPDFEKIIKKLQSEDCDILLLTPGGCKSCMTCQREKKFLHVKNTRFSDLSVWNCNIEELTEQILKKFPENKVLYLVGSIVMEAIGFDMEELCFQLQKKGKNSINKQKVQENS